MNKVNLYKKVKWVNILLPLIITIIFCIPLYGNKIHIYGDILYHLNRIVGISDGLKTGTFPIYIYPYTNYGYGYGSPMFYCDLFLIPSAILYILGLPLITTYKVTLFIYYLVLSYISFYVFRYIFKDKYLVSVICTLLYCFSDTVIHYYHIGNGLGNIIALAFLPLLVLAIYKLFVEKKDCWLLLGTSFALILLSHLLTFVICVACFGFLLIIYLIVNRKEFKKTIVCVFKAMLIALGLGAFFFFPLIEQLLSQKFWSSITNGELNVNFINESQTDILNVFSDFLFNGTNFPGAWNKHLGTLLSLGSIVSYTLYRINTKKNDYNLILIFIILCGLLVETDIISIKTITHYFPFIIQFQFIWRINIVLMPISVIVIGNYLNTINKNNILLMINIFVCIYLLVNVGTIFYCIKNSESYVKSDGIYEEKMEFGDSIAVYTNNFNTSEIAYGEYLPVTYWYGYCNSSTNILFSNEDVAVWDFERKGTTITFTSDYPYAEYLYLPLSWYKGYYYQELDSNGNILYEKECGYNEYTKRVEVYKEEGSHTFKVYYKGTIIQKISLGLSIISFIYLVVYCVKYKRLSKDD